MWTVAWQEVWDERAATKTKLNAAIAEKSAIDLEFTA
jgi:hypothetical protein